MKRPRLDKDEMRIFKMALSILARQPWEFGVVLQEGGWLSLKELQKVLVEEGLRGVTKKGIFQLFQSLGRAMFEIQDGLIRAHEGWCYGDLDQGPIPPDTLYWGFRKRALPRIRQEGARAPKHGPGIILSSTSAMAERIIMRRTHDFIIVEVSLSKAISKGLYVRWMGGGLFVVPYLLPSWLTLPPVKEEGDEYLRTKKQDKQGEEDLDRLGKREKGHPGSFLLEAAHLELDFLQKRAQKRRHAKWDKGERRHRKGKNGKKRRK